MTAAQSSDGFHVAARAFLGGEPVYAHFPAGLSIGEALGDGPADNLAVNIGGVAIPRGCWHQTRPKNGITVNVVAIPQGGGNGGKILRSVALIAIAYFAPYAAGYLQGGVWGATATGLTGAALTAGIGLLGALAVNPLVGAPLHIAGPTE